MSYLKEFKTQIENNDFSKFMQLWEEYCTSDTVDVEEFIDILKSVKHSDLAKIFGQYIETALPLWQLVKEEESSYNILRLLIDIQNTNTPTLAETALTTLKKRYANDPSFNERLRLVGLRTKENFQGAIANYDLLAHLKKGNFVFHHGGWGTGEIIDVSPVMEQVVIEFENIRGRKDLSFANAFKTLIPLPNDNFLARRFADADLLEKEAKENPVAVIRLLLRDLGPKNAAEIKDELSELVIPESEWTKWWQNARAKVKKDTMIESPTALKDPFILRKSEVTHAERFQQAVHDKTDVNEIIQTTYNHIRDLPNILKNKEMKASLQEKLETYFKQSDINEAQKLQLAFLLENHFNQKIEKPSIKEIIQSCTNIGDLVENIDIIAFKKRVLVAVKEYRQDWVEQFLNLFLTTSQTTLRDYILKELDQGNTKDLLLKKIEELLQKPGKYPEVFVWYFQKVIGGENVPFSNKEGQYVFFEAFLVLFNIIETKPEYRDLLKKMYHILSGKRYETVRAIFEKSTLDFVKEFLLLASKCQSLTDHDMKILRSLAEVVHSSLASKKKESKADTNTIWTTEEGYFKTKERIKQIGTTEIVENAKEIEAARALGDLRENSEYKFALERRSRLQAELKMLSEQLNKARIITKDDIHPEEVGVGSIVDVEDSKGKKSTYIILGPWDADPDKNILSFQSKLAQMMLGCRIGDRFQFKDDEFKVLTLTSFLNKTK